MLRSPKSNSVRGGKECGRLVSVYSLRPGLLRLTLRLTQVAGGTQNSEKHRRGGRQRPGPRDCASTAPPAAKGKPLLKRNLPNRRGEPQERAQHNGEDWEEGIGGGRRRHRGRRTTGEGGKECDLFNLATSRRQFRNSLFSV